jgi:uncharacterized membrane protein YidH (DUF202 family)
MWGFITGLVLVIIFVMAFYNIRSLIRKMKANPSKKIDLLIGIILLFGTAAVLVGIQFLKHIGLLI